MYSCASTADFFMGWEVRIFAKTEYETLDELSFEFLSNIQQTQIIQVIHKECTYSTVQVKKKHLFPIKLQKSNSAKHENIYRILELIILLSYAVIIAVLVLLDIRAVQYMLLYLLHCLKYLWISISELCIELLHLTQLLWK